MTAFKENIFLKLFEIAEIARLDNGEFKKYQENLNAYRDIKNSVDTAREEGIIKGKNRKLLRLLKTV